MVLASGSKVLISVIDEVTRGVTPGSGTPIYLRLTQRALNLSKNLLESEEVRASGQEADVRHGFRSIGGNFGFQLSHTDQDPILAKALRNTWASKPTAVTGVDLTMGTTSGGLVTLDRASGSFTSDGYVAGSLVLLDTLANAANNTYWVVRRVVSSTQLELYDPGGVAVAEGPTSGAGITSFRMLKMGNTLSTWSAEREFVYTGGTDQFQLFGGVTPNTLQLTLSPESIVTGAVVLLGMNGGAMSSSRGLPGTPTAVSDNEPFGAFDGTLVVEGVANNVVTAFDFTINNNRSTEPVVGSYFTPDIFDGTTQITGNLTSFLEDTNALYNAFRDESTLQVLLSMADPSGNRMLAYFPRLKLTSAEIDPPQSGAVPQSSSFRALEESDLSTSLILYAD